MEKNSNSSEKSSIRFTGEFIKESRINLGLTQTELCKEIFNACGSEPSKSTIVKWEQYGKQEIKCSPLFKNALIKIFEKGYSTSQYVDVIQDIFPVERRSRVDGKYRSKWFFDRKNGHSDGSTETLVLKRDSNLIIGNSEDGKYNYKMIGVLNSDGIYSGHWYNLENAHHGTFMLRFKYATKSAEGLWIGT